MGKKKAEFIFPALHQQILDALDGVIEPVPWWSESGVTNKHYSTMVMGRFVCYNSRCARNGWGSKTIAITISAYKKNGYHAVVYGQRCEMCGILGALKLNKQSYIDRVVYSLKVWAMIPVEVPTRKRKKGKPHRMDLCEGCKRWKCLLATGGGDAEACRKILDRLKL